MLVIPTKYGRLSNRLFTFAHAMAFAMEHRLRVLNPAFAEYADQFEGTVDLLVPRWPRPSCAGRSGAALRGVLCRALYEFYRANLRLQAFPLHAIGERDRLNLEDVAVSGRLCRASLVFLSGFYFLAPQCLRRHADQVRRYFTPTGAHRGLAEEIVGSARAGADILVGVHMRQGDYRTFCGGIMFYSSEEYASLMRRLLALWPDHRVAFVVCSDEPQAAAFAGLDAHPGPGTAVADLHALALCDYIVGPSSTFSRWASFWGGKPLWRMDWKAEEKHGSPTVTRCPELTHFAVCYSPSHVVDGVRE